jgi:DNA gyrase/topoisomerase IV subunit B
MAIPIKSRPRQTRFAIWDPVINAYAKSGNMLKEKDRRISGDDIRAGLTVGISIKIPDPRFEGQTKIKLSNEQWMASIAN